MTPLLNAKAEIRCAHGGSFVVAPRGSRPQVGGAPALTVGDLPGSVAVGCGFTAAGVPAPCTIVSVLAGACSTVAVGADPAANQALVCATSNGAPTQPVTNPGQEIVHGS